MFHSGKEGFNPFTGMNDLDVTSRYMWIIRCKCYLGTPFDFKPNSQKQLQKKFLTHTNQLQQAFTHQTWVMTKKKKTHSEIHNEILKHYNGYSGNSITDWLSLNP